MQMHHFAIWLNVKDDNFQVEKKGAYLAGYPLSFHHVWQDISMKLS